MTIVATRRREIEIHHADLGASYTQHDWPDDFVAVWLPRLRTHFGDQVAADVGLDERDELAWLYGRFAGDDLPVLPPWG